MVRLVFALPFVLLSDPALSQTDLLIGESNRSFSVSQVGKPAPQARTFTMPIAPESWAFESLPFAATEIAPNATFGIGMFGLRRERSGLAPATVREVNSRRTRRAGVGFSFKF